MRRINALLRKNRRELERLLSQLAPLRKKTEGLVRKSAAQGNLNAARIYAREMININNQYKKLHLSKTRLELISMAINEQYQMRRMTQQIQALTAIMRDVNSVVSLGMVLATMQDLSKELMKAGIIEEMMDDMVDAEDPELEDELQEEINKVIEEITKEKLSEVPAVPDVPELEEVPVQEEPHESEDEEMLKEMRQRLRELQE